MRAVDRIRPWRAPVPSRSAPCVIVVGGGAAGLTSAALLRRCGVDAVIHDRAPTIGGSWPYRYDSLRLNTVRWMSDLPGFRMGRGLGRWVVRDDFVAYLREYAEWHRLEFIGDAGVRGITRAPGDRWAVESDSGRSSIVDGVVVATGHSARPIVPDWPGMPGFSGEVIHSSRYRRPDDHLGRRVVVVGGGSSGGEIVVDLVEAGVEVTWSIRGTRRVVPREMAGIPTTPFGAVADRLPTHWVDMLAPRFERLAYGPRDYLPEPASGLMDDLAHCREPMTADGAVEAIRDDRVRVVGAVEAIGADEVVLDDDTRVGADVIIAATGYRSGLEHLVAGLGVLDDLGRPVDVRPCRGLGFVGFRIPLGGTLWAIENDARRVARDLLH